jgi:alkylated DNA repair dioxygenase AlkB
MWSYTPNVVDTNTSIRAATELSELLQKFHEPERPNQPLFMFFSRNLEQKYRYFRSVAKTHPFPPILNELVSSLLSETDLFDTAFVNLYRSGKDFIGPHRDSTHGRYPIVSFSFYPEEHTPRILEITTDEDPTLVKDTIIMEQGSMVVMNPEMHFLPDGSKGKYLHGVPPSSTESMRINVTFRCSVR